MKLKVLKIGPGTHISHQEIRKKPLKITFPPLRRNRLNKESYKEKFRVGKTLAKEKEHRLAANDGEQRNPSASSGLKV